MELKSIRKSGDLDRGTFKFSVSPPILNIRHMDLDQYVSLICQDTTYKVSDLVYDSSGQLALTVDYTSDMEGRPCVLEVSFDSSIVISPNISLNFDAVSNNMKLIIINKKD